MQRLASEQVICKHDDKDHDGDDCKKLGEPSKYMVDAFFSGIIELHSERSPRSDSAAFDPEVRPKGTRRS
jgi:hypothetical protein